MLDTQPSLENPGDLGLVSGTGGVWRGEVVKQEGDDTESTVIISFRVLISVIRRSVIILREFQTPPGNWRPCFCYVRAVKLMETVGAKPSACSL